MEHPEMAYRPPPRRRRRLCRRPRPRGLRSPRTGVVDDIHFFEVRLIRVIKTKVDN